MSAASSHSLTGKTRSHGRWVSVLALCAALGLGLGAGLPHAASAEGETTTYQSWKPAAKNPDLQKLVDELKVLTAKAEKDQAASPDFLDDLKALTDKYAAAMGPAPGTLVFKDDFTDGNFTANPVWKVSAGSWTVDTGGKNTGLNSKIGKLNASNLLGAILAPKGNSSSSDYASIYSVAKMPNAVTLKTQFLTKDKMGGLSFAIYQGANADKIYRVLYSPGANPGLTLQLVTKDGAKTIGSYNNALNLENGNYHSLSLSRTSSGKMRVSVDDQQLINVTDNGITGDFDGLLVVNSGGSYWIKNVSVVSN